MAETSKLEIEIERSATDVDLRWPTGEDAEDDSGLGCNREYADLRGMTWRDCTDVLSEERELTDRTITFDMPEEELDAILEEAESADEPPPLFGLDLGVASTVVALSAARCTPVASCNGGAFGTRHHEAHPLVLFCARPQHLPLLLEAAKRAEVGLVNAPGGYLLVYSDSIERMPVFAEVLWSMRGRFRDLRFRPRGAVRSIDQTAQPELPF